MNTGKVRMVGQFFKCLWSYFFLKLPRESGERVLYSMRQNKAEIFMDIGMMMHSFKPEIINNGM